MKTPTKSSPFVVKAQCNLFTTYDQQTILIYDYTRTVEYQGDVDPSLALMVGDRSFWWAALENTQVVLDVKRGQTTEENFKKYNYRIMNADE